MPSELSDWLSWLEVLSFDLGSVIFPSWTCVGGLPTRIAFNGLWPLVLIATVAVARAAVRACSRSRVQPSAPEADNDGLSGTLRSLEVAVFISFLVLPSVTRSLFLAFQCESFGFDDIMGQAPKSYLTASLNVECTSDGEHGSIIALAAIFIVLWPVAMPLLYGLLLFCCRRAIRQHQPTGLSRAIRFLWSECPRMRVEPTTRVLELTRHLSLDARR